MRYLFFLLMFSGVLKLHAQDVAASLEKAVNALEKDEQFVNGTISMYVVETNTGKIVFGKNIRTGLAPASCQKIITSVSAFELLGKTFTYKTDIGYGGKINNNILDGSLIISGSGDPTIGSWRWKQTTTDILLNKILAALTIKNIRSITGGIKIDAGNFSYQPIPDGWIWQDIGNYYGAGAWGFNWHENQYDLNLRSTNTIGQATEIVSTGPADLKNNIVNLVKSAKKGSGDNVYIYAGPYNEAIFATGTIPVGENKFTVAGSMPDPPKAFANTLSQFLTSRQIAIGENPGKTNNITETLATIISPPLDSINYWFLKKSVNLYGEVFVKTIAVQQNKEGNTDSGIAIIKRFWKERSIQSGELKMQDGSGLSPSNRITTNALVQVMLYAKKQPWFQSFYQALPEMNGIKMKDGYIGGVRSYTGYVKSRSGTEYTFAFIVNNFDGSPSAVREKMWRVLDLLK